MNNIVEIIESIKYGDINYLRFFLENEKYNYLENSLIVCIKLRKFDILNFLLDFGIYPNHKVLISAYKMQPQLLQILIDKSTKDVLNNFFVFAANRGDFILMKQLLGYSVDINYKSGLALRLAARNCNIKVMSFLMQNGVNIVNDKIMRFASEKGNVNVVNFLLDNGCKIGDSLIFATINGHIDVVNLLLKYGADPHIDKDRPFVVASKYGRLNLVRLFLRMGADIHAYSEYALIASCLNNHIDVVKYLLDNGADIDAYNGEPLRWAVMKRNFGIVKLLIEEGANINANNGEALKQASLNGNFRVVELLIENGAIVRDEMLIYASRRGHINTVKKLVENGGKVNVIDSLGYSPLKWASIKGYVNLCKFLIENGADMDDLTTKMRKDLGYLIMTKPDGMEFRIAEECPITSELLTDEVEKAGCSVCKNVFKRSALEKWIFEGNQCPFKCGSYKFYSL